jgi:hypothetical protein
MVRKALLCGINAYPRQPLRGCVNDAQSLGSLLVSQFDFQAEDIHLLLDAEGVKSRVRQEWQWLTAGAAPGDTLVFHFSGHGSNVPDQSGDETDGRDEITCLYDMDFDDPNTYILDDEWYEWVSQVRRDANLIIVKDTCHSGGSSRVMAVRDSRGIVHEMLVNPSQARGLGSEGPVPETQVSVNRFMVPPDLGLDGSRVVVSSFVKPSKLRRDANLNLNLMACKETQTAADAYINGTFNGAFTYYLCQALRAHPDLDSRRLIKTVAASLKSGYEQVPVHEGRALPGPIFGGTGVGSSIVATGVTAVKPSVATGSVGAGRSMAPVQERLIEAYMKLLDTVMALEASAQAAPAEGFEGLASETGRGPGAVKRVLVSVHGIGKHKEEFSKDWWKALSPYVGGMFEPSSLGQGRIEVVWSDLVNSRSLADAQANGAEAPRAEALRESILEVIEDRGDREAPRGLGIEQRPSTRGFLDGLDDFLIYMLNEGMRRQILDRFTSQVGPLLDAGVTVDVMSHSWGTVVAYEGLRELEARPRPGRVAHFFTVGSALSIGPVQETLRPANRPPQGGRAPFPSLANNWINLDAQGDLVGGSLARRFPVSREYLNLLPTTCAKRLWGYDLGCAHGSYFQASNTAVNRDIFAAHLLDQARGVEQALAAATAEGNGVVPEALLALV